MSSVPAIYQLSYRIVNQSKPRLSVKELEEAIRVAGERVLEVVSTGWSMFHQFTRDEIKPRIVIDTVAGEEIEAIETNLREDNRLASTRDEIWRITADGRATLIRPYREDTAAHLSLAERGLTPGMWLSPRTLIRELYELATHAKELSKSFPNAEAVEFCCTWQGLKGRKIGDFTAGVDWRERKCHADQRTSTLTVSLDELTADTADVVAKLGARVLNLFDGLSLTRDWILREVPKFRTL
jgi:hypothetical protein